MLLLYFCYKIRRWNNFDGRIYNTNVEKSAR